MHLKQTRLRIHSNGRDVHPACLDGHAVAIFAQGQLLREGAGHRLQHHIAAAVQGDSIAALRRDRQGGDQRIILIHLKAAADRDSLVFTAAGGIQAGHGHLEGGFLRQGRHAGQQERHNQDAGNQLLAKHCHLVFASESLRISLRNSLHNSTVYMVKHPPANVNLMRKTFTYVSQVFR